MLEESLKEQLREHFSKMTEEVVLRLHPGEHERRTELTQMLESVASLSPLIRVETGALSPASAEMSSGASFDVLHGSEPTGIRFHGIPGGHEFSSLVLAILQAGGFSLRLDPGV